MNQFWLNRQIQRLEKEVNDDLLLIMEFGAEAYTTAELMHILEQVSEQKETTTRWQHRLFLVGFSISVWIGSSFLAAALGAQLLSFLFLAGAPLCLTIALMGHLLLRYRFPTYLQSHLVASIIQQELDRRRKDASIY